LSKDSFAAGQRAAFRQDLYGPAVPKQVVLLRGINIGPRNRIAMPKLREVLEDAGFEDVATYVQSGNVVLSSSKKSDVVSRECERLILEHFGLEIDVVTRTRAQLAKVAERDPLGKVATNPKRYQVSFLAGRPPSGLRAKLERAKAEQEAFAIHGREIYAWHPEGVARSKLWALLAGKDRGVTATARNWTTVTKLLELAS
jgi:uncharacterized protein (DUF1697 family)